VKKDSKKQKIAVFLFTAVFYKRVNRKYLYLYNLSNSNTPTMEATREVLQKRKRPSKSPPHPHPDFFCSFFAFFIPWERGSFAVGKGARLICPSQLPDR